MHRGKSSHELAYILRTANSAVAYRAILLQAPYSGAKAAILDFTMSLRTELLHDGSHVHVTMGQMAALNTPQFDWCKTRTPNKPQPVPPTYQPEIGAGAVYWAAHHRRRDAFVGSSVASIQLNKLIPALLDRYLARAGCKAQPLPQYQLVLARVCCI